MFAIHSVFHIAVCCYSFSSLFDIVLSCQRGTGVVRSNGKEEFLLSSPPKREEGQSVRRQQLCRTVAVCTVFYSFHEAKGC